MQEAQHNNVNMGVVYDVFSEAFRKADQLPTWRFVGKPAMEKLLQSSFGPNTRFLDFGSASARVEVGVLLPNGVVASNITGVEISPEQVAMAQGRIPEAHFIVGDVSDTSLLSEQSGSYDVVFLHMVSEHLDDAQFARTCANAHRLLKSGGMFAFVVTHPDKMTNLDGSLVTTYGAFKTTAPWGGELHNYRRSIADTVQTVKNAGFDVEVCEELQFSAEPPGGLDTEGLADFEAAAKKYRKYPAIRLAIRAKKA
ncbi:class I SAM-dependent methyltransferase [Candidatus Kaiserbacteria bacterium]|nr:class I SAM-dependent methyltransferase [Candidatus Kaiserbacteria bacterium]